MVAPKAKGEEGESVESINLLSPSFVEAEPFEYLAIVFRDLFDKDRDGKFVVHLKDDLSFVAQYLLIEPVGDLELVSAILKGSNALRSARVFYSQYWP